MTQGPKKSDGLFWTYWTISTVNNTGTAVAALALPMTAVIVLGASTVEVGLVAAASYVGWLLLGLPAGVLVARYPLRAVQVSMSMVRAVSVATIPIAWAFDSLTVVHLVACGVITSCAGVLYDVASQTYLPRIVPSETLVARNSVISGTDATIQLGGPAVAGVLIQIVGAVPALIVDCVSYLVSGVMYRRMPEMRSSVQHSDKIVSAIAEGCRFVFRHPVIGPCVGAAAIINLVCGAMTALVPIYLLRTVGLSPAGVGIVLAAEGVGSLVGAALCLRVSRAVGTAGAVKWGVALAAVAAFVLVMGTGWMAVAAFVAGSAGFAFAIVIVSIVTRSHRQAVTPEPLMSRVIATVRFVSWGALPIGAAAAGFLGALVGERAALVVCAVVVAAAWVVVVRSPVRGLRNLDEPQKASAGSSGESF